MPKFGIMKGLIFVFSCMYTPITYSIDSDNNGVSDIWQIMHGDTLPSDAAKSALDSDGDHLTDWEEAQLGSDPENAASIRSEGSGGDLEQYRRLVMGTASDERASDETAARFLMQSSIGFDTDMIAEVRRLGFTDWIDHQLSSRPTLTEPYIEYLASRVSEDIGKPNGSLPYHKVMSAGHNVGYRNSSTAWIRAVLRGDDYLRQRTAWALSQIFVVSNSMNVLTEPTANYYDMLITGAFDNYEDLLLKVTMHPVMGRYLSYLGNKKENRRKNRYPDENYAREIMQLFSIGLWELNLDGTRKLGTDNEPIPSYENHDVQTLARVFTGFVLSETPAGKKKWSQFDKPMLFRPTTHDMREKKALKGKIDLPAGQSANSDVVQTIRALANHPNTAPFFSRKLINHLITSNPSPEYIRRVASVWLETSGNLGQVVKSILLDPEARGPKYLFDPNFGRMKEPLLRVMGIIKGFNCGSEQGMEPTDYPGLQWWNPSPIKKLQQEPMRSPSVFNFFEATYVRPGAIADQGLVSPEFQLLNDVTAASVPNYIWNGMTKGFHRRKNLGANERLRCNYDDELSRSDDSAIDQILDYGNLLFSAGTLRASTRKLIAEYIRGEGKNENTVLVSSFGIAVSSEGAIQR